MSQFRTKAGPLLLSPYSASPFQNALQTAWSSSSGCECVCWAQRWRWSPRLGLCGHCCVPWTQNHRSTQGDSEILHLLMFMNEGTAVLHVDVLWAGRGRGCIRVEVVALAVTEAGASRWQNRVVHHSNLRQEWVGWRTWGAWQGVRSWNSNKQQWGGQNKMLGT